MIRLLTLLSLLLLNQGEEQFLQDIQYPDWDNSVQFLFVASQKPVRPGDSVELAVVADIKPGYHLYGPEEKPPSCTVLEVIESDGIELGSPSFPPVIKRDLAGLGEFDLYEGEIAIRLPVTVSESAEKGSAVYAHVRLHYQVCTETACSAPTSTQLEIRVPIVAKDQSVQKQYPDIFSKPY
jgi:hypothetical protein